MPPSCAPRFFSPPAEPVHGGGGGGLLNATASEAIVLTDDSFGTDGVYSDGVLPEGSYLLSEDISLTTYNITIAADSEVTLDLNGHILKGKGSGSVIVVNGILNLKDSDPDSTHEGSDAPDGGVITGSIQGTYSSNASYMGGGVYVSYTGTLNMYGGSIWNNYNISYGAGVGVCGGTFNMYGGAITGNGYSNAASNYGAGVAVVGARDRSTNTYYTGTFNMYGGSISDNYAKNYGGGVYVSASVNTAVFNLYDGTISGNTGSLGGGVYIHSGGTFYMKDGEITGNSGSSGGGVNVDSNGTFYMEGGSISGNTSSGNGGGITFYGEKLTIAGGTISGNTATNSGGGLYIASGTDNEMSGGEISGNLTGSGYNGGGIYVDGCGFKLSGGNISGNGVDSAGNIVTRYGGGVYIASAETFVMTAGSISENSASAYGGGVCAYGPFNLQGGSISNNTSGSGGDGVFVYYSSVTYPGSLTMSGGTISGSEGTNSRSGVYVWKGTFEMSGGTLSGNGSNNTNYGGGAVCIRADGSFIMAGGTITENSAVEGGAVYVLGGFTMSGGKITGNTATYGGAVYVDTDGTFEMSGGEIYGNSATDSVDGVYYSAGTVKLSGTPVIDSLYIYDGLYIQLAGDFSSGASVTISLSSTITSESDPVRITTTESTTSYYATAYQYFRYDSGGTSTQVGGIADGTNRCVNLGWTDTVYYTVELALENLSATSGATTAQIASGETFSITLEADEGYTLPTDVEGLDTATGILTITVTGPVETTVSGVPNTYTVRFYDGDGTALGTQGMTYGTEAALQDTGLITGYTIDGWATEQGGAQVYAAGATVLNLTSVNGGTFDLYVSGKTIETYTATFVVDDVTYDMKQAEYQSAFEEPTAPTKDGHVFVGWYTSSFTYVFDFAEGATGNVTLYALWAADSGSSLDIELDSEDSILIQITEAAVSAADSAGYPLEVSGAGIAVTFSADAVATLDGKGTLTLSVSEDATSSYGDHTHTVTLTDSAGETVPFAGSASITIPVEVPDGFYAQVYYIGPSGLEAVETSYTEEVVTFRTAHFSQYATYVLEEPSSDVITDPRLPVIIGPADSSSDSDDEAVKVVACAAAAVAAAMMAAFILLLFRKR